LDGTRFDAWTRRRFGLATGGAVASMLGLLNLEDAEAKKKNKNKNKNKKKKKKKCKKHGQSCDIDVKKKKCCSEDQLCAQVSELGSGNVCCKQLNFGCSNSQDCCGDNRCHNGTCRTPS
jgi:hypothetical protein